MKKKKNKSKYQQKLKESAAFSLTTLSAQDKLRFQNERFTNSAGSRNRAVLQVCFPWLFQFTPKAILNLSFSFSLAAVLHNSRLVCAFPV